MSAFGSQTSSAISRSAPLLKKKAAALKAAKVGVRKLRTTARRNGDKDGHFRAISSGKWREIGGMGAKTRQVGRQNELRMISLRLHSDAVRGMAELRQECTANSHNLADHLKALALEAAEAKAEPDSAETTSVTSVSTSVSTGVSTSVSGVDSEVENETATEASFSSRVAACRERGLEEIAAM